MAKLTETEKEFLDSVRKLFSTDNYTAHTASRIVQSYVTDPNFNVNASKGDGNTALHILASHYTDREASIFKLLLDNPATKLNEQNGSKKTPTQLALRAGKKEAAVLIARAMDQQNTPGGQKRHKDAIKRIQSYQETGRIEARAERDAQKKAHAALMAFIAAERAKTK